MDTKSLPEIALKQLDRVLSFFARVEAKASFVFALNSGILGSLAVNVQRPDLQSWPHLLALFLATTLLFGSYYNVYRCSFPNLKGGHASLIYFKEIAKLTEQQFVKQFRAISNESYVDDLLGQIWRNSEILTEKFRALKIAFTLTALSLIPWTVFLALASATHATLPISK